MKIKSKSLSIFGKLWNISGLTSQKSFPKFMQLPSVTQHFLHVVGEIKSLKKCLSGREKLTLNTIGVVRKVWDTIVKGC